MQRWIAPSCAVFSRLSLSQASSRTLGSSSISAALARSPSSHSVSVCSFHTSVPALGVMDTMRTAYGEAVSGTESKREAAVFKAQMKFLLSPKRIDGDVFLELLAALREASGLGGVKEHLPWVANNPALGEFKRQEAVIRAFTPAERRNVFSVGISAVKRVAAATGEDMQAVEGALGQIQSLVSIQKWMRKREADGLSLPQTGLEMQNMMMKPGSGVSRRPPKGRRLSPGVKGGMSRR